MTPMDVFTALQVGPADLRAALWLAGYLFLTGLLLAGLKRRTE